jgi:hypothetical protein
MTRGLRRIASAARRTIASDRKPAVSVGWDIGAWSVTLVLRGWDSNPQPTD